MGRRRNTAWLSDLLDRPTLWFATNMAIHCCIGAALFALYVAVESGRLVTAPNIAFEMFFAAPALLCILFLPTAISVAVLWHIRPATWWRFRLIAGLALLWPLAFTFAFDLHLALYELATQITFALIMLRSRPFDLWEEEQPPREDPRCARLCRAI